jgi:hypothetical protein
MERKLISFCITICFVVFVSCQKKETIVNYSLYIEKIKEADTKELYIIDYHGKYGFIDYEGNLVIPFEYTYASNFNQGVAKVSKGDEYFYISKKNEKVIINESTYNFNDEVIFDEEVKRDYPNIPNMPSGYVLYENLGNHFYCIAKNDQNLLNVDERIAAVINEQGDFVIEPREAIWIERFSREMALIRIGPRGFDGYLRKDGRIFWTKDYIN